MLDGQRRSAQTGGDAYSGGAVGRFEAGVAAAHRQTVDLAHRGQADDADAEIEVGGHPFDHRQLLGVLAPEHRHVRLNCGEQLRDHGGDTTEVTGPVSTFERFGQHARLDMGVEPTRVHRGRSGCVHRVDTDGGALLEVGVDGARIALEVGCDVELQWVDEDRHDDGIGMVPGLVDQCQVAGVQRAHRGHEPDPSTSDALALAPGPHRSRGGDDVHGGAVAAAQRNECCSSGHTPWCTSPT